MEMIIWMGTLVVVPIVTYRILGFYVSYRMASGKGFTLWSGLLEFHPIDTQGKVSAEDVVNMVQERVDEEDV